MKETPDECILRHKSLLSYYMKQHKYYALLLQAVTDSIPAHMIKKVVDRHFDLMKEYDDKANDE